MPLQSVCDNVTVMGEFNNNNHHHHDGDDSLVNNNNIDDDDKKKKKKIPVFVLFQCCECLITKVSFGCNRSMAQIIKCLVYKILNSKTSQ